MEEAKDESAAENDAHNLALQAAAQLNGQVEIGLVHLRHCSRDADYAAPPGTRQSLRQARRRGPHEGRAGQRSSHGTPMA